MKKIAIIGGGPSALMLATQINTESYDVTLFEKNKAVGRKFLVAGDGGLNLTYNCSLEELVAQYFPVEFMSPILEQFTNGDLIGWFDYLGVAPYVGSSNRVFPDEDLKPIEVLNKISDLITENEVKLQLDTKWLGWNKEGHLSFDKFKEEEFDIVVFALGGASWEVTGSDGLWDEAFKERGINVVPFNAANCAFAVDWNKNFISTHQGKPLKNIALTYQEQISKGELVLTEFGLEGNAIYALSQKIQQTLLSEESVVVHLDLKPTMTVEQIRTKYNSSDLPKITDTLKDVLNIDRASIGLLKQFTDKDTFLNPDLLSEVIKAVPIVIQSADGLEKAISSLGGVDLDEVDENFQIKKIPNTYVIGEMLDWYAPTGGYLLQACFSMGFILAEYFNDMVPGGLSDEEE